MPVFLLGSVLSPITNKRPLFRGGSGAVVDSPWQSLYILCALQLLVSLVPARPTDQGMKIEPKILGL